MGVFFGKIQGYSFLPAKNYTPTKQAVWCTRNLHKILWNSGGFYYSELPIVLASDVTGEYFAKGTEKCKVLRSLLGKEVENLDHHDRSEDQDLISKKNRDSLE